MAIDKNLINHRLAMIIEYTDELVLLSGLSKSDFMKKRNAASAESFIRRSLEAIFDIGRHILAKSNGINMAKEYKSIARGLGEKSIVSFDLVEKLIKMAGYRNRMVHLYHQVTDEELYHIVRYHLEDIREIVRQLRIYTGTIK